MIILYRNNPPRTPSGSMRSAKKPVNTQYTAASALRDRNPAQRANAPAYIIYENPVSPAK